MAKGEQRSNREAKKPKKEKIKVIAAAPSQKGAGWQPTLFRQKEIVTDAPWLEADFISKPSVAYCVGTARQGRARGKIARAELHIA